MLYVCCMYVVCMLYVCCCNRRLPLYYDLPLSVYGRPTDRPWTHVTLGCHALWMERNEVRPGVQTMGIDVSQHAESIFDGLDPSRDVYIPQPEIDPLSRSCHAVTLLSRSGHAPAVRPAVVTRPSRCHVAQGPSTWKVQRPNQTLVQLTKLTHSMSYVDFRHSWSLPWTFPKWLSVADRPHGRLTCFRNAAESPILVSRCFYTRLLQSRLDG